MRAAFFSCASRARLCLMTYTFWGMFGGAWAADPMVWIALSETGGAYAEAAAAVKAEIERPGPGQGEAEVRPWSESLNGLRTPPRLIIAVGGAALRGIVASNPRTPVLAVLVPESAYERVLAQAGAAGRGYSAVLLDQPPVRQIAAVRLALPERQRIGVLFGPESRRLAAAFQRGATESGAQLVAGQADSAENIGGVLQRTIEDSDLLLAVADPVVFNNASVQNILTAAYRRRIPVAAFSPGYVTAGALLALYSTPKQLGAQAGDMARTFLSGRPLPPPQAPRDFVLGINGDVARSLGIPLRPEDAGALAAQLQARERRP